MAIAAAHSLADYAEKRGIDPENIVPSMSEASVFPQEAADVAIQAIKDGVARVKMTWDEAFNKAKEDIDYARGLTDKLTKDGYIKTAPQEMLQEALEWTIERVS